MVEIKLIKSVETLDYSVELLQIDGGFRINYVEKTIDSHKTSEMIKTLEVASMLYDMKEQELAAGQVGMLRLGF